MTPISIDQCAALETENCKMTSGPDKECLFGGLRVTCTTVATNFEVGYFLTKIANLNASRPLVVTLCGQRNLTEDLFAPVAKLIIDLVINSYKNFHLSAFTAGQVVLPTLQYLDLSYCSKMTIKRTDFQPFPALRRLALWHTAVESIEEGAFESLLYLRSLALERDVGDLNTETSREMIKSIFLLHCGSQYKWLRDFLNQRPYLIAPDAEHETYNIGGMYNLAVDAADKFPTRDCSAIQLLLN